MKLNSADGRYDASIMTKALVIHNGTVIWEPPAIYRSSCTIDVEVCYFVYSLIKKNII
jgi:nicotinic acetylcholine receptor